MADEFQEKTERATPRKKQKAREKGQVARSRDLTSMITMGGIIMICYFGGKHFISGLSDMTGGVLSMKYGSNPVHVSRIAILHGLQLLAPFLLMSVVLAVAASVMQGGIVLKPIKIEFDKINPLEGVKRLFSLKGLTELLKSIINFTIGGWVVYYVMKKNLDVLPSLAAMEIGELARVSGKLVMDAIIIAFSFYFIVALASYFLEKWQYERSLRMTKQEIKDEFKESEGDPMIKSRIRSVQREAARKRMMQEVPTASVVITNPTHLAVAIKYIDGKMAAPQIVAKGAGLVAQKIKDIAGEHGVPIVEDKPLARALYKLELNAYIPEGLYVAVARILAYIYKLRGRI
ncbi:MAG: flagellar biosynthesis protein FlhB [Nitrospiraceae bacterium]|nr:MAG: flagellar biosynthesis protein FlhB [Nitrospiraceae bacterium]